MSRPPEHTIAKDDRLVAYVWQSEAGALRRAGAESGESVCDIPFAEVLCYDRSQEALLQKLVEKSESLEAFFFALGVEGFRVTSGDARPHAHLRRF